MQFLRSPRFWAVATLAAFVIIGVAVIWGAYDGWTFWLRPHDRSTVVTVAIGIDALLFGVLAAFLALIAYLAASGQPKLSVEVSFPGCEPNRPVLFLDRTSEGPPGWANLLQGPEGTPTITIRNLSAYSAKNPGVRITTHGFGITAFLKPGWTLIRESLEYGKVEVQWDGGTDNIIHGNWTYPLPMLQFGSSRVDLRKPHVLKVTLVADGTEPRVFDIPMTFRFPDGNIITSDPQTTGGASATP